MDTRINTPNSDSHPVLSPYAHSPRAVPSFNLISMKDQNTHNSSIKLPYPSPLRQTNLSTPITTMSNTADLEQYIQDLEVFTLHGRDKRGRRILRIVGRSYPARVLSGPAGEEGLKSYLAKNVFPKISDGPFCIVYIHTCVQRSQNFPGVAALRSLYEALPAAVRGGLEAVYFVHPGLQARLFLAMLGRFLFSSGLYGKVRYVSRLEFLAEHVRRGEVEVPEFVEDHDEALERRPLMDYGLETDHHRVYDAPAMDSAASMYSLRCIS